MYNCHQAIIKIPDKIRDRITILPIVNVTKQKIDLNMMIHELTLTTDQRK